MSERSEERNGEPTETPRTPTPLPIGIAAGWSLVRLRGRLAAPWTAIAFALALTAIGLVLRWAIGDPEPRFIVLYPTVAVAALLAGPIAGLTATLLTALALDFFYIEPRMTLAVAAFDDAISLVNFVLTGLMISLIAAIDQTIARRMITADENRRATETHHRALVDQLQEGVLVVDRRGTVVSANSSAERMLGQSFADMRETMRSHHDWPLLREDGTRLAPEDYPIPMVLRTRTAMRGALAGLVLGEVVHWFLYNATPLFDADGRRIDGVILSFIDVTEHRRADLEIAAGRARLRSVFSVLNEGVLLIGRDGAVLAHNPSAERILGHPPGTLDVYPSGFVGWDLVHLDGTPMTHDEYPVVRVFETGHPIHGEVIGVPRDDGIAWLLNNADPMVDPQTGEIEAVVVSFADITERRRKERLLAERDEELRQTLDAAGLGVWWLDTATERVHCDGRSRTLFDAADEEDFTVLADRFDPEDAVPLRALPPRLAAAPLDHPLVLRRSRADASPVWLSLTARLRRKDDGGEEIWGTVQDVTEARRAEEAMRRFEAARRIEALGRMTGGIAHDLNNLLTVVSGNLQLLEMSPDDPAAGRWIAEALKASESGAALNERLLTFASRRRLDPALTDLDDLIAAMVDMLHRSVGPEISIATVLGAGQARVRVDPAEIENAVLNLVLNARDAMPSGGRIIVETAPVVLDATALPPDTDVAPGPFVRLSVSDTGHGMTPEVQARAFEPFFTTKDVGRGSGLGLSTLHGFVRQSGGFVTLSSEVGHGTVVDIHLPRSDATDVATKPGIPPLVRGAGETILLVEDDADVRRVMRERLKALGYRVETAADPTAARAVLDAGCPVDLVLSDVVMPGGITGLDFARALRAADPERRIVVTSGFAGDLAGGPTPSEIEFHFLRKPHSLAELATTVAAALRTPPGQTRRGRPPVPSPEP